MLLETHLDSDPLKQFRKWFNEAAAAGVAQPEAMTLATALPDGKPSARMVLLRAFDERGFCFFTNYESRKGCQLAANGQAALVFFWGAMDRQVLVEGQVEKTSEAESDNYFNTRPRESRISAWASPQSEVLPSREVLEKSVEEIEKRFAGQETFPRPPHWGGFRVVPNMVEFWQGQPGRLHDRIRYRRNEDGGWVMERLAP